jgi:nucleotide-binding universal stress UspA family protein
MTFAADPSGIPYFGFQSIMEEIVREAHEYVEGVAASLRQRGLAVSIEIPVSPVADGIVGYARQAPGTVVVLSTHARSGWRRFVLGSVARRVVQTASTPVIVCPPPRAQAAGEG